MTTYSLTPYTIRILGPGGVPQRVDSFLEARNDLFPVLEDYLLGLKARLYKDTAARFILRVQTLNKDKHQRFLYGRMDRGEYGIQSELFNTTSMKTAYTRTPEDAELLPYHFFIGVPRQAKGLGRAPLHAIAVFQTMDGMGIQDVFDDNFSYHFANLFAPLHVNIERLIPKKFVKQLLKRGRVTQLRFIQYQVPTTLEGMAQHGPKLDEGILEFRVKAKRGMDFDLQDRLREVVDGKREIKKFLGVEGFPYDDVKIQLESDGKYHTLNLGRLESARAPYEYDITGKLAAALTQKAGQPSAADLIDQLAREYCESLARDLDLTF